MYEYYRRCDTFKKVWKALKKKHNTKKLEKISMLLVATSSIRWNK